DAVVDSMPKAAVCHLHVLDGCTAPGASADDRLALELEAPEASQALRRVHCVTIAIRDIYLWSRSPGVRSSRAHRATFNPRRPLAPAASMDYQTTLEHLYRLERFGIKPGLDNIRRLLSLLCDPQRGRKVLHVTGPNGKGSVCAYAASVLRASG